MISGDFTHCRDLPEFYESIRRLHADYHGKDYVKVHDAIVRCLSTGSTPKRYVELGVNQGATLAAANLVGLKSCKAIDHMPEKFKPYKKLFDDYVSWPFEFHATLSTDKRMVEECDVLYIDTKHTPEQIRQELMVWGPYVTEYVVAHDTWSKSNMQDAIEFWSNNNGWEVEEYNTTSVGFTVIKRKK